MDSSCREHSERELRKSSPGHGACVLNVSSAGTCAGYVGYWKGTTSVSSFLALAMLTYAHH